MDIEEHLSAPDGTYLPDVMQNYARALGKMLQEVPAVNGAVDVETLWLESALPRDLIIEVLEEMEVPLPPHVEKVVQHGGRVLRRNSPAALQGEGAG